jgi:DNA-binding NarL/FixJ family response regulator
MPLRILIVDDHELLRAGLRAILEDESGFAVVGEAADGAEALERVGATHADIVLMDLGLPGMGGIETTRRIKSMFPEIHVLVLTVYEDESFLREAIKAGASGYVIKRSAGEDLIRAIYAVQRGDLYIHPAMTRKLFQDLSPEVDSKKAAIHLLTSRELEVMRFLVRGFTSKQIAEALFISARTVEGHRANLMSKLDLKNRVELVEFAQKNNLI